MLVSVLYRFLLSRSEKKTKTQPTAAKCNNMNPGACRLLLKEEQMKDKNAVDISSQGKVPVELLSSRDV